MINVYFTAFNMVNQHMPGNIYRLYVAWVRPSGGRHHGAIIASMAGGNPCFNLFIASCSLHREALPGNADIAVSTGRYQLSDDVE